MAIIGQRKGDNAIIPDDIRTLVRFKHDIARASVHVGQFGRCLIVAMYREQRMSPLNDFI